MKLTELMKITIFLLGFGLLACELDLEPPSSVTGELLSTTVSGVKAIASGCLMMMKEQLDPNQQNNHYVRHFYHLSEFPSDNVLIVKPTPDPLWYSFTREHAPNQYNTTYLWGTAYKIILNANTPINLVNIDESSSAELKQYVGECYFYRGLIFFDLARLFAFPPALGKENLGLVLRTGVGEDDNKARATVSETYRQIISDLRKGADLMTKRNVTDWQKYGNKWAAMGLLSRAYLYNQQYDSAIYFANKVINESGLQLEPKATYISSFWNTTSSDEALFLIYYTTGENRGSSSLGSMYNANGGGWGEIYPSKSFRDLLGKNSEDVRSGFIDTVFIPNTKVINEYPGSTFQMLYINKFSNQDNIPTLSSPMLIRLSEMYLNRAEANVHLGNDEDALTDVNIIRKRAGLIDEQLITLDNLASHEYSSVLNAVLGERRLELAFEGFRRDDLMRNKIDLDKSYPSAQNLSGTRDVYPYDGVRQIYLIPSDEVLYNKNMVQNPL